MSTSNSAPLSTEYCDLLKLLGYLYLQSGRPEGAATLFNALHAVDPDEQHAAISLACAYIRCGKPTEALSLLDQLQDHDHVSALTHLLRSQALISLKRTAEAARSMRVFVMTRATESRKEEF
ncbi:MAG TPA: tetratricopeptide repeat protein [Burkholderiaceae bacterium]|nr:tetratricopeptide repeat protein [Burkholderiaceae bacterium]